MATNQIYCPLCYTNMVDCPEWAFEDTSVEVPTCKDCKKNVGPVSVTMKVSGMQHLTPPAGMHSHCKGLFDFS